MAELIHEYWPRARKTHRCMASDFVREDLCNLIHDLSFTEKREVVKARRAGWRIQKGETYIRQFCRDGGDAWSFKAIPAMHQICLEHKCYPEDY